MCFIELIIITFFFLYFVFCILYFVFCILYFVWIWCSKQHVWCVLLYLLCFICNRVFILSYFMYFNLWIIIIIIILILMQLYVSFYNLNVCFHHHFYYWFCCWFCYDSMCTLISWFRHLCKYFHLITIYCTDWFIDLFICIQHHIMMFSLYFQITSPTVQIYSVYEMMRNSMRWDLYTLQPRWLLHVKCILCCTCCGVGICRCMHVCGMHVFNFDCHDYERKKIQIKSNYV
jgi:hypothetical protein